ncbi:MAG: flagellar export chaperone FlgN [Chloroflexota bacterium]|nr:flagellar export chaperone FlgN [Chloroflexota bacterium]
MEAAADRDRQSELETALLDVHGALTSLVAAADEQYAAVAERDRERMEGVTRQQERISTRLERAERRRREALAGRSLAVALADEPARVAALAKTIALAARVLRDKHARTASLIEASVELNAHTIDFLQRLAGVNASPVYGGRGAQAGRHSVLLDSRA